MDVCVIGAGYVGLITSCSLAYLGHNVSVVESHQQKLAQLQTGRAPFYEPGLDQLLSELVPTGRIKFTDSIDQSIKDSSIIFITVGTPSLPTGEPDLTQVSAVARAIGGALDGTRARLIVNKSTVPVGSGNWVEMLVTQGCRQPQSTLRGRQLEDSRPVFSVISNPEFLREGSALHDTFYADRIIVGSSNGAAIETMRQLYMPLIEQTFEPPDYLPRPNGFQRIPFITTDIASAEMIKYSANAFLSMKISFINEIANLCEKVGADVDQVAGGIGLDQRIGRHFLNAGVGWGGSCFGKDVRALIDIAREYHMPMRLLEATIEINERQREQVVKKLQEELKIIKGRTIGLMGLAFKPNTDDLRDAPSLAIAAMLQKMGAHVRAYDPVANESCARSHHYLNIEYCTSIDDLASNADALVLVTDWEEFQQSDWMQVGQRMRRRLLIDGRNFLPEQSLLDAGFTYRQVGR